MDICCHYAQALYLPKSVGLVYGALYASEEPLCFDEIQERSGVSKGGVSQTLRFLRDYEAVRVVTVEGDRRDYYEPVLALRSVLANIFRDRLEPAIREGRERIESLPDDLPADGVLHRRVKALRSWNQRARFPLSVLERMLK